MDRPDAEVCRRGAGRRQALWLAAIAMLIIAARPAAGGFSDSTSRQAGGLTVDLAVIPASFVLGHSPEHTGQGVHGGRSSSRYSHHLIVAVFDSQSGLRVTDATVRVFITSSHHPAEHADLEPMALGGAATYGGFVDMPPRDTYHISVEVRRGEGMAPVTADFWHRHWQP
jgi:hypothetical protein